MDSLEVWGSSAIIREDDPTFRGTFQIYLNLNVGASTSEKLLLRPSILRRSRAVSHVDNLFANVTTPFCGNTLGYRSPFANCMDEMALNRR
jgi:hypothetical protein